MDALKHTGVRNIDMPLLPDRVYDALTTSRVYKPAYSHEVAKEIILEGRGKHFDPDVVDAFLASEDEFLSIKQRLDSETIEPVVEDEALQPA